MKIVKVKTKSIAHLSYVLNDGNEVAVIDPRRDVDVYLDAVKKDGAKIKYIFETHRNEDLVTGSRELKRFCDATIYHGKGLDFEFGEFVQDNDEFSVGNTYLKILETPGHTPESISIAVYPDKKCNEAVGVFTGDALFVDDVGRTDFFEDRMEEFAGMLFDSIKGKILPLGDQTVIYPAHGAGSVCGGGIADREVSTVGYEKIHNPMLQLSREDFIKLKVSEKHQQPPYFKEMERINLKGDDTPLKNYQTLDGISAKTLDEEFKSLQVIDLRSPEAFLGCHIPNTLCLPAAMIGAYAGYFADYKKNIVFVSDDSSQAEKAYKEFLRLGYNNVKGFLRGGIASWETSARNLESFKMTDVNEIINMETTSSTILLDVRKPDEWEDGTIKGARTIFLGDLESCMNEFDKSSSVVTYCGSGKRATIAASILAKNGISNVAVFMGSMKAYKKKIDG